MEHCFLMFEERGKGDKWLQCLENIDFLMADGGAKDILELLDLPLIKLEGHGKNINRDRLEVTKPTCKVPSKSVRISIARG